MSESSLSVPHLARLSRLALSEQRMQHLQGQLESVVHYVDTLAEAQAGMPVHQGGMQNVAQQDVVDTFTNRDGLLAGVPRVANGYIMVRAVSLDEGASA